MSGIATHRRWAAAFALLLVAAAGTSHASGSQPTGLRVQHRQGQTFIVWNDVDPPALEDGATSATVGKARGELTKRGISYRVYRSARPITSVAGLTPVGRAAPLSCWNTEYYGRNRGRHQKGRSFRWVIEDGASPLPVGSGIYVHNPATAGAAYYAVTYVEGGNENTMISGDNATTEPVTETVGQGAPVLQRVVKPQKGFQYIRGATLNYYVRWEAPPNCSVENKPIDYLVAVPPKVKTPWVVGLHLHCWGGNLDGGYAWWGDAEDGAILLSSNQIPYDWWTGYHELYYAGKKKPTAWREGVVRPYSTRRMFSFLDWLASTREVDLARTFVAGNSMGGSGSVMCAVRYADRIAWCRSWVGVHNPAKSPRFKGSYEGVYGPHSWGVKFEDGTPVWDYYNDTWYLRQHPNEEIGFISFCNGKNDGAIGWPQAVEFVKALQETRRPHLFIWGQSGHSQRTVFPRNGSQRVNPIDMRLDQSQPAFTRCSLDDDIGTGTRRPAGDAAGGKKGKPDPFDGARAGQINRWLYWETGDVVDEADRWQMTVALMDKAPQDACAVDITPRRLQELTAKPGDRFTWSCAQQRGRATADEHGLITLPQVRVTKGKVRVSIERE